MITHHQAQLWGGLAAMAVGGLTLLALWAALVAGICVRLFGLASGRAQLVRKPRHRHRAMVSNGQMVTMAELLDGGAGRDTAPLEAVRDDH